MRLMIIAMLGLIACSPAIPQGSLPPHPPAYCPDCNEIRKPNSGAQTCKASKYRFMIGKQARALETLTIPQPTRLILPNSTITEDYSNIRINFSVGKDGKIVKVWCG